MEEYMPYIWILIILVASALEAVTAQLISIWFVVASIVPLILSLFKISLPIQILVFTLITIFLLLLTRPIAKRFLSFDKLKTNSDRYIGLKAMVTETIDNLKGTGQVVVSGTIWTARTREGEKVEKGEYVKIEKIDGVKLIVSKTNS